ncbi:hypothetical protein ACQ4M4_14915 [Leptolyngbya sp. AN02str]|jgi:hypothetical protein|uniref:Uncharacterized protein n=1 Tax=Leptolyngbya sp. NK1-12 TaxID=2547451 RepID=A0AA97AT40_9CYAN|nr:hypothetical protein [Leptolyngbya sp. NK1-12]WNZ28128.1 hypothetical protein HJG54_35090 [Leptolyngbya sp. NK1-12]
MNDTPQTSRKREDFSFRYSPYTDTPDGVLTAFLKRGDGVRQGKELMLESARAFWMVAAHQAEGLLSQEELRQLGLSCCRALERQAAYIRECLQLPIPSAESSTIEHSNGDRQNSSSKPADRATRTMWQ